MKAMLKLGLAAGAVAGALAVAGPALATPRLVIGGLIGPGTAQTELDFCYVQASKPVSCTPSAGYLEKTDAAAAQVKIYIPAGYTGTFTASAGTKLGTVHAAIAALGISPDAIIEADGDIVADNPAAHVTDACAPGTHTAVWIIKITVSGVVFNVPIYIDAPLTGAEAALGVAKLTVCFTNPYVKSSPADLQPKVLSAQLKLNEGTVVTPTASGKYVWDAIVTPWTVNGATPNAAGTVEARAIVQLPEQVTLKAKVKTTRQKNKKTHKTKVTNVVILTGALSEDGTGIAGIKVTILGNGKSKGTTTTNAAGSFSRQLSLTAKTSFQAHASVPARDATSSGCAGPAVAPAGCASATLSGFDITSAAVTATPKKK